MTKVTVTCWVSSQLPVVRVGHSLWWRSITQQICTIKTEAGVNDANGLGLILGGALFYARVTFETLVVFNFKVP